MMANLVALIDEERAMRRVYLMEGILAEAGMFAMVSYSLERRTYTLRFEGASYPGDEAMMQLLDKYNCLFEAFYLDGMVQVLVVPRTAVGNTGTTVKAGMSEKESIPGVVQEEILLQGDELLRVWKKRTRKGRYFILIRKDGRRIQFLQGLDGTVAQVWESKAVVDELDRKAYLEVRRVAGC